MSGFAVLQVEDNTKWPSGRCQGRPRPLNRGENICDNQLLNTVLLTMLTITAIYQVLFFLNQTSDYSCY